MKHQDNSGKVYVVLLNWFGWRDTIECIESLKKSDYKNFQILIADNDSKDDSIDRLTQYLNGKESIPNHDNVVYQKYVGTVIPSPVAWGMVSEQEAENGTTTKNIYNKDTDSQFQWPVIIIRNNENYGTARGNNIPFRYALKQGDAEYIWVLNNDTIVPSEALSELMKDINSQVRVGATASVLRFYDSPEHVQTLGGGRFFPILGTGKLIGKGTLYHQYSNTERIQYLTLLDHMMSCSMLVKAKVMVEVGLYDEDFFVYTEETEWSYRVKKAGWTLSIAFDSFVFHKESASTKGNRPMYFYLLFKHNQIFLRKQFPVWVSKIALLPMFMNAIRTGKTIGNIKAAIRGMWDGQKKQLTTSYSSHQKNTP